MRKKILVRGPALTMSGYGEHTRFLLRSLRTREELFDIYLMPLHWGHTSWSIANDDERKWFDELTEKTVNYMGSGGQFDISAQVTIPNEWEKIAPVNIGVTAGIETNKVAPVWLEKSRVVDKIVTISEHSKTVYNNTAYLARNDETGQEFVVKNETPIEVVHYPVKDFVKPKKANLELEYDFNFLTVAQWGPRKNLENTIKWFAEEFIDQEVGLVVKTNLAKNCLMDREACFNNIKNLLSEYENRVCKVYLIHGHLTDEEMAGIYKHSKIKAYMTATHGEGFGLPIFEAAYYGLPIVAPDWSGHVDFLSAPSKKKENKLRPHYAKVDYELEPVPDEVIWQGVIEQGAQWCQPRQGSFKMKLREVHKNYSRFKSQATRLKKHVVENFSKEKQYEKFCNAIVEEDVVELEQWLQNMSIDQEEVVQVHE